MTAMTEDDQPSLAGMDLDEHLADPRIRQRFVTTMFDIVAPRYDRFTRVFSLGMDAGWKRELLSWLERDAAPDARVLDLACGTGDLAFAAASILSRSTVIGLDASPRMIAAADVRRRASGDRTAGRVRFALGDMMQLPEADRSIDVVMVGYGLRNVPDPVRALAEIARVLRPGGLLLVLDFYRPEGRVWRTLFLAYLRAAGNLVGWLWHREPVVYGYIASSIDQYVSSSRFSAMLERAGLAVERERRKLLGGIALHAARRRDADSVARRGL